MSLYKIVLMSYVEGWIAAIKTTMSPGMPIRLGKKGVFNNTAICHFQVVYLVVKPLLGVRLKVTLL